MTQPWHYQAGPLQVTLRPLPDACWAVQHWMGVDESTPLQQRALLSALREALPVEHTLMVDDHRSAAVLRWLQEGGLQTVRCKYLYEKQPLGTPVLPQTELIFCSLAELGEDRFLSYLIEAATDDPEASAATSPEQEYQELLAHAGEAFDPHAWGVVFLGEQAVGVLLPQVFFDKPSEGTLSYLGVMPDFRGKGYGALLHQWGLHLLAQQGVTRYIGSTGHKNIAMQRVFERNGCRRLAARYFLGF